MATQQPFAHAGFLAHLEDPGASASMVAATSLPPLLAGMLLAAETGQPTQAAAHLIQLLKARKAMWQAAFGSDAVADALRRYQKFARPGQPSPHIVQLRQQQAAARQASSQSRQSFVKAAAAFVREAGIEVPQRVALELFITRWIDINLPKESGPAT
jgi:hypothetical protein